MRVRQANVAREADLDNGDRKRPSQAWADVLAGSRQSALPSAPYRSWTSAS
jgi:hypothetical protein